MKFRIFGRGSAFPVPVILLLFVVSGILWGQDGFSLPGRGSPGDVLSVSLPGDAFPLESISLLDENGRVLKTVPFFSTSEGKRTALLPLDSTLVPGNYLIQGRYGDRRSYYRREFILGAREFRRDVIPLNQELTYLRTEQDELQRNEALEIQAIYGTFNRTALHDRFDFTLPIQFEGLDYFRVSSEYGDRRIFQYTNNRTASAVHTGIDMAAREGVPVHAAAAGRVVLAKNRIISGYSVVIEHLPGVYSIYFHLKELSVKLDQMVKRGERIGSVGRSGLATGPHLHWEIRVNGTAVDPRELTERKIIDTIKPTNDGEQTSN